jgi:hypothetical protein
MTRLFLSVGLCALIGTNVLGTPTDPPAATPAPAPTNPAIAALIDQLGADQFAEREAATAALYKLDRAAADALQQAANSHPSPEVRTRAARLLVHLQRGAESNSRLVARRVKLDYRNIPLGTAVNDLKARTGLPLVLDGNRIANPLRRVSCETPDLPVWEALEAFCVAANLREAFQLELDVPRPVGPRRGYVTPPQLPAAEAVPITLIDGTPDRLPGDRSRAVRILALPPRFPGHKTALGTGEVSLCLDVTPAPGLNWQEIVGVKITRVVDSAGRTGGSGIEKNPLPNFDPTGTVVFARPGVVMRFDLHGNPILPECIANPRVVAVPLKITTPTARSLRCLEGAVYGEVLVPNQHLISVSDLKKNTNTWYSGPGELRFSVLEIKEATRPGELHTIRVQMEFPSPWAAQARRRGWNPGWPEAPRPGQGNQIKAFDAADKPLPAVNNGITTDMTDDGTITIQTIQLSFRKESGLPARLVVVGPRTVIVEVPFAMQDVALP